MKYFNGVSWFCNINPLDVYDNFPVTYEGHNENLMVDLPHSA